MQRKFTTNFRNKQRKKGEIRQKYAFFCNFTYRNLYISFLFVNFASKYTHIFFYHEDTKHPSSCGGGHNGGGLQ